MLTRIDVTYEQFQKTIFHQMSNPEALGQMQEAKQANEEGKNNADIPPEAKEIMDSLRYERSVSVTAKLNRAECLAMHKQMHKIAIDYMRDIKALDQAQR
mmetsp:Transcript_19243/g.29507  ORF Transcript_19243/g.29507 Transcript_19243/m.29507 type:complete len:100 (-) Transcript_19243:217-516(-)